ncbi:MAG: HEAT repeat domain-containing protein [Symploca sp. SIO1B1]|nr:HEAT repeat domain-containing protein [Symploca sp. SIO1C2]NER98404.1 HEAT repeat domain-containing protein [Symploca sp. SIO1B1]
MSITRESVQQLLNSQDYGERLRGINQLRQLEPAVAFELVQPLIKDPNTRVRYAAVSLMDVVGTQDLAVSLDILRDRLSDPEPDVQAAAADALGALKLTEAYDDLQQLYQDTPEWLVKVSIIATLGELGEPRSFELLLSALSSENSLIQTMAISALGELGNASAVPLLIPYADHSDWQMRHRVAQALIRLGGTEARSTLETLANDPVAQVAQEAQEGLN